MPTLIPTLNAQAVGASYTNAHPITTQFPGHRCMGELMTPQLILVSKFTWVIDVLGLFFDMLSMRVFTAVYTADARSTGAGMKGLYCKQCIA